VSSTPTKITTVNEALLAIAKMIKDSGEAAEKRRQAEVRRRAALSPAALAQEQAADARAKLQQRVRKFAKALGPYAEQLRLRESWTLSDFAKILTGKRPDGSSSAPLLMDDDSKWREVEATLESCVGTRLHPLPIVPPATHAKYPTIDLLRVAKDKRLGDYVLVAHVIARHLAADPTAPKAPGPSAATQPQPSLVSPPPIATTLDENRERKPLKRRKHLLEVARLLVSEGNGIEHDGVISLAVKSDELQNRTIERYPQWKNIKERTWGRDRSLCVPRIELVTGRPRKPSD